MWETLAHDWVEDQFRQLEGEAIDLDRRLQVFVETEMHIERYDFSNPVLSALLDIVLLDRGLHRGDSTLNR